MNNRMNNKSKKNSLFFRNNRNNKKSKRVARNKVYTKSEFQKLFQDEKKLFKKKSNNKKANFIIMYDTDAPNGEGEKENFVYIHYLKIGKKEIIEYNGPTPPRGIHNYHAKSILFEKEQLKKLYNLLKDKTDRKDPIYSKLEKNKIQFEDINVSSNQILRENSFKVKA
tara:strand:- start:127 stop:630 length:504 start_codon:yes stop_codon:yes gene_type:complete